MFKLTQDITIYDKGTNTDNRFTYSKPIKYEYRLDFKRGESYPNADRVELGMWLIANNFIKEDK